MNAAEKNNYRLWLHAAQKGLCIHCLRPMYLDNPHSGKFATFDHATPRCGKIGTKSGIPGNVLLAHAECNNRRQREHMCSDLKELARTLWAVYEKARNYEKLSKNTT